MAQESVAYAPTQASKARPLPCIISKGTTTVDFVPSPASPASPTEIHSAVYPDYDSRPVSPVSPVSECSQSSESSNGTARSTKLDGFGRKRHSVLPTVSEAPQSTRIEGFGRKHHHHHRHSIAVIPPSSTSCARKRENRRSLPNPVRLSLDIGSTLETSTQKRRASILEVARKVSDTLSSTTRQPPKPLLLPKQVQTRGSFKRRVKRRLVGQLISAASSRPVKHLVSRLSALHDFVSRFPFLHALITRLASAHEQSAEPCLRPLKTGRRASESDKAVEVDVHGLIGWLKDLLYRQLRRMVGF